MGTHSCIAPEPKRVALEQVVAPYGRAGTSRLRATTGPSGFSCRGSLHDDRFGDWVEAHLDLTVDRRVERDLGQTIAGGVKRRRSVQDNDGDGRERDHDDGEDADGGSNLPILRGIYRGLPHLRFRDGRIKRDALALGGSPLGLCAQPLRFKSRLFLIFAFLRSSFCSLARWFAKQSGDFWRHAVRQIRRWIQSGTRHITYRFDLSRRPAWRKRGYVLGNLNGFEVTERELGACLGGFRHGVAF